jgi:hypothetical protein
MKNKIMKKIEDYLHLYFRCECMEAIVVPGQELNFEHRPVLDIRYLFNAYNNLSIVKPILRPLSDMTEEELIYCIGHCYHNVYGHSPEFIRTEVVDANDESAGIVCEEPGWRYGLTISVSGIDFSANGDYLHFPIFETTRYLLSKHFDLFGLIEAGLAIDKTKI